MTRREQRGWLVVASLFVALFFVFGGGYDTAGVFFAPMSRYFHWSSTRQSSLQTVLALSAGVAVPLCGWLLDRVQAGVVMSAGTVLGGAAMLAASRANSFGALALAYVALGVAIAAATLLPSGMVIANWFRERRGLALGIVTSGTSLGGMVMTLVAARAIAARGWRAGFIALALPTLIVAAPLVALLVRTRPPGEETLEEKSVNPLAGGVELGPALRSRSFWMVALVQFCYSFAGAGATVHTVPYLLKAGFRPERAAQIFSATFGLASLGKFLMGYSADFLTGRVALATDMALAALGQFLLLGARSDAMLAGYVLLYGTMCGAPLALTPMVIAESFGLKRFGSVSGLTGICITLGGAAGPVLSGLIYDRGLGYPTVFVLFTAVLAVGSVAALACSPMDREPAPSVGGENESAAR